MLPHYILSKSKFVVSQRSSYSYYGGPLNKRKNIKCIYYCKVITRKKCKCLSKVVILLLLGPLNKRKNIKCINYCKVITCSVQYNKKMYLSPL